jgi:hypothetical protein
LGVERTQSRCPQQLPLLRWTFSRCPQQPIAALDAVACPRHHPGARSLPSPHHLLDASGHVHFMPFLPLPLLAAAPAWPCLHPLLIFSTAFFIGRFHLHQRALSLSASQTLFPLPADPWLPALLFSQAATPGSLFGRSWRNPSAPLASGCCSDIGAPQMSWQTISFCSPVQAPD